MKRRHVLALTALSASALAMAMGVAAWAPGLQGTQLTPRARRVMGAVAACVLTGMRPAMTEADVQAHLSRLDQLLSGLPGATRADISDLLGILAITPGRWALAGMTEPWTQASQASITAALQSMRASSVLVQQQAYQALRELTIAAHFGAELSWTHLGYPGPKPL